MSDTLQTLILAGHLMLGIMLVTIILIQRGKGSDAGMAFGGGSSDTVFGAAGSGSFLTKTTKWMAIAFFCTSMALAFAHKNRLAPTSILDSVENVQQEGDSLPVAAPLPGNTDSETSSLPDLTISTNETDTVTSVTDESNTAKATATVTKTENPQAETPEGE